MKKSIKQLHLEEKVLCRLTGITEEIAKYIFADDEIKSLQDYANTVSIKRLGFNDHGPVHMLKATLNALTMLDLLTKAGVKLNLEAEGLGSVEDSRIAVFLATSLHDIGMSISRDRHELMSVTIAQPILNRILDKFFPDDTCKRVILRSIITEGILGHMATQKIHSLEAGLVLIGDGCDMEKGRARISMAIADEARRGDIHRYSSNSIRKVKLLPGNIRPILIEIEMSESVGFFQVEEVLYPKIQSSPVKKYIELKAGITGKDMKQYL